MKATISQLLSVKLEHYYPAGAIVYELNLVLAELRFRPRVSQKVLSLLGFFLQ